MYARTTQPGTGSVRYGTRKGSRQGGRAGARRMARAGRLMYLARAGYAGNMTGTKNVCIIHIQGGQPYVWGTAGQAHRMARAGRLMYLARAGHAGMSCWHVVHTWQQAGHGAVFRRTARMRFTWLAFPMLQAARLHRQLHHRPSHRCRYR